MIDITILQANSSHPEAFIGIINAKGSPFADRARVTRVWDEDPALARAAANDGVKVVERLEDAIEGAGLVMICGRWADEHPDLAVRVAGHAVPVFIDKPVAASHARAMDVAEAFAKSGAPAFSASAYRYDPDVLDFVRNLPSLGAFRSGQAAGLSEWAGLGPKAMEPYFYAVHTAEMIQAVFGTGMESLTVLPGSGSDLAIIEYADGRRIDWHLLRDCAEVYEVGFYGSDGHGRVGIRADSGYYESMLDQAVTMAETGISPLDLADCAEIVALLDAVTAGRAAPGKPVRLASAGAEA
jgi:predicted dehydrogenase